MPGYPKMVKIEELRIPESTEIAPYCTQMDIQYDGSATPVLDKHGHEITFFLNETDPTTGDMHSKRAYANIEERGGAHLPEGGCSCVWLVN